MIYSSSILSVLEVLLLTIPVLLTVAYVTVAERKTMASMQRRLGPNIVGYYGLLQAFADALKLLLKEYVSPTQANFILFFLGPIITLIFSLLGYGVIPYAPGLSLSDFHLGILYVLAMSSLATYGILLAGWSANSKYAFLGSLRSTAQLISYELILSSSILLVIFLSGSLNLTGIIESQKSIWFIIPLFPIFLIFFIGSIAETNRAPFDLAEAESELVSGFMTEHAAVIFVFFFLAEYASILLICLLSCILFLGGYLINIKYMFLFGLWVYSIPMYLDNIINYIYALDLYLRQYIDLSAITYSYTENAKVISSFDSYLFAQEWNANLERETFTFEKNKSGIINPLLEGVLCGMILGFKSCIMVFVFIWARASFPRIRFDQLMTFCWTILLPIVVAFIIFIPCILYNFEIFSWNNGLL